MSASRDILHTFSSTAINVTTIAQRRQLLAKTRVKARLNEEKQMIGCRRQVKRKKANICEMAAELSSSSKDQLINSSRAGHEITRPHLTARSIEEVLFQDS
ncbi:hypothetical protein ONS95_014013 [Cadophora gregata]|uniref:uncharacterized protein n=1 Tax=Cadophora gregata TaxID=51156 RepID=UPI0026DB9739|nr:uncharacterized protein ONS95_014013 [Cadophora gregata]KAK0113763.1 hypothetical protein ONS96_014618 [Cadophora gregata f. sp. sojae]KAK0114523.1 hypothetical protein ONS95_014013 [Cadophora gregata]